MKRGGAFVKNIIDDPINKNIELYYAVIQFASFITLQKISTIETLKNKLKNQMKNAEQKDPYYV
ncbi:DNA mismatch repair protein MutT [Bacillus sp. SH5-2]|uniref:DNA mismatch repair protein MutT n=1 Tax=Bacillus cereus group TaxID=86661 RepID=UPI0011ECF685|nr:DNA mismatch repair protein MutT [Bacillus sp. SH5-2]KAA0766192.1 DNA mismatch repair protein MutT [Bacillus sp. SH5-2]